MATAHQASPEEISEIFHVVDRDLRDCLLDDLSSDWQLSIAYNAALQSAKAALAASGYRASRKSSHYRIMQSLKYTVQADEKLISQFDMFRKKRNISDYERAGRVSNREVKELIKLAKNLRFSVERWMRSKYPNLRLR